MHFTRMMILFHPEDGIKYGSAKTCERSNREPLKEIRKGLNIFILQESNRLSTYFEIGDMYVWLFHDLHKNDTETAFKIVAKLLEQKKTGA